MARFWKRKFLRLGVRWWLGFLSFPLVLLLVVNWFFSTSLGTGWIEDRVEAKFDLGCEIGSLSWTPWSGVTVREVQILGPENIREEFCYFEKVSLDLAWGEILRGKKRFESLSVEGGHAEVSMESLKRVLSRYRVQAVAPVGGDSKRSRE